MSGSDTRHENDGDRYSSKGSDHGHGGSSTYDSFEDRSSHYHKGKSRESDHKRSRTRERDQDRYDQDRYNNRDVRHRDYKGRIGRNNRGRDTYRDHGHPRDRAYDRHHEYDQNRERRRSHRSRSRSKDKSKDRSRSRSCSRSPLKSKRTSGFDMAPAVAALLTGGAVSGQLGGPQTMPGMFQNMLPFETTQVNQLGAIPLMPAQAMTQQATRHARRVYVGGLPPLANEQSIATFFSGVMTAIGGNSACPGDAVVNVYINHEKKFAFVEMRTVEEASNAMALDGIVFEGVSVRVRRPTDYNPSLAAALGPSQPSPHLNLAAVGLTPGAIGGAEGPDRIFVGGLPYYFTEAQIRELLESFGPLHGFDLVRDRDTGNSKGYGFCIYKDPAAIDVACAALNGLKMGDKTLTVRRATISSGQVKPEQEHILAQAQQHVAMQKMALQASGLNLPGIDILGPITTVETPTNILCLTEVITADELVDDQEYEEILEDMREECEKFGHLKNIVIPRPDPNGEQVLGVGKVFLEYSDPSSCAKARDALSGRKFGSNIVTAVYYPEERYYKCDYGA